MYSQTMPYLPRFRSMQNAFVTEDSTRARILRAQSALFVLSKYLLSLYARAQLLPRRASPMSFGRTISTMLFLSRFRKTNTNGELQKDRLSFSWMMSQLPAQRLPQLQPPFPLLLKLQYGAQLLRKGNSFYRPLPSIPP